MSANDPAADFGGSTGGKRTVPAPREFIERSGTATIST
jgi:hypothetical protein